MKVLLSGLFFFGALSVFAAESFERQAIETFLVEQTKQTNAELKLAHETLVARGYEPSSAVLEPSSTKAVPASGTCNLLMGESHCELRYLVVTTYNKKPAEVGKVERATLIGLVSVSSPKKRGTLLRVLEDGELTKLLR